MGSYRYAAGVPLEGGQIVLQGDFQAYTVAAMAL